MATPIGCLHFILVPLMSQSHLIPFTDLAKLLAQRGVIVTIITTPLNASALRSMIDRAVSSNLKIQLIQLPFPCHENGLPDGCENLDTLPSSDLVKQFFDATGMLRKPLENLVSKLKPRPSCIISSNALPWAIEVAHKFQIPSYIFHGISCFTLLCSHLIAHHHVLDKVAPDSDSFLVPEMPNHIEFTSAQLPGAKKVKSQYWEDFHNKMKNAELLANGLLVNTFEELELAFVKGYNKVVKNILCIGPVSLCNKEDADKFDRGKKASIDEDLCLKWLDAMKPSSVVYACFGSLCHLLAPQVIEIGLGLEASNRPFIWIIRESDYSTEVEKWVLEGGLVERVKGRGLIIGGWAPQVLILSHPSIGAFLTHCGWNSVLEGVCTGMPMITWPMFAEQFYNEKLVVQVLRIGVRIGVEVPMQWGSEEKFGIVKSAVVKKAVDEVMDEGKEGEERRKRARELGEVAKKSMEEGGSAHLSLTSLIQAILQHVRDEPMRGIDCEIKKEILV